MSGGYDYFRINYMIFSLGFAAMLKRNYFEPTVKNSILYYTWQSVFWAMTIVVPFDMISDGYLVREDAVKLTYSLSTSVFYFGSLYHFALFRWNKKELEACLDILDNDLYAEQVGKSEEDLEIFKSGEKQLRALFKIFYFFAAVGMITRVVCHLAPKEKTMLLPFPNADDLVSPFFGIMFFFQMVGMTQFLTILVASQMVILGFLIRVIKHFEVLKKNIERIKYLYFDREEEEEEGGELMISERNPPEWVRSRASAVLKGDGSAEKWQKEKTREMMKDAIIHHQKILGITTRMNRVLGITFFMQVFGGGLVLGILCVDLIWKSKALSMKIIAQAVYASGFLMNTTILCFLGSKIETKSHEAANSLYGIPWLEMDKANRKTLVLFLFSLWKHPILRAVHILPVNLNSYVNFIFLIYDSVGFMNNAVNRNK